MSIGFEDPEFLELCLLVQEVHALRSGRWSRAGAVLRRLRRAVHLLRALRRLPHVTVGVSAAPAGQVLRRHFRRGPRDRRPLLGVSVLSLPAAMEEYRRGRSRQAFRTNSAKARRSGVRVVAAADDAAVRDHMKDLFDRRDDDDGGAWYFRRADAHEGEFWFALDVDGGTLALCEVIVDDTTALLRAMLSAPGTDRSNARFLLMSEVLASLIDRGVRHLLVDRVFSLPPGLVYFQRLLGFAPVNLTLAATAPGLAGAAEDVRAQGGCTTLPESG